ncbi:MAG: DNA polymerase III subunit alpha [Candidatus Moraniibacteriota bacterium]
MSFVHLHTHSHYSLLTALPKPEELLKRAKELGMTTIALTDTSALYGAVEFYSEAKHLGMKPILGAEMWVAKDLRSKNNTSEDRRRNQLVLLVKNETGYKNLLKIISIAQLDGFYYKARADKALLRQYGAGLIALSGSLQGEIPSEILYGNYERAKKAALEHEEIFGKGNFYLEIQPHLDYENQTIVNQGLIQISRETGIPLVAASDVHYLRREDAPTQDILLAIRDNKKVTDKERFSMMSLDLSLRSPEEMAEAFKDIPEAVKNTEKIAEACQFELEFGKNHLPTFPLPKGKTADEYLRELCMAGLEKRYPKKTITPEQKERMNYELSVIEKTGFASYFLIVADFVNWAKDHGVVVGPGRGSAAGSFVAYLTGITNIDPIEFNLIFERFLNPERISMPDIDMDFADTRRDDVLNYVREKYGHDHVAQIITFGTMAARGSIRDVGRALGVPLELCDKTAKMIPMFTSIKEALSDVPEFKAHYASSTEVQRLVDSAQKIEGLARHASMHACGVVITQNPVTDYTPLQRVAGGVDAVVTQYAASTKSNAVEKIGLLKMDFLGLKNLSIIENTLKIAKKIGKEVPDMDKLALDDAAAYQVLQDAHTTGVFQLESTGMKRYLKQLKPTVFEDIIAMVALYRPGPMDAIPDFIESKHGRKEVTYLHPILEPILKNTYGVIVTQDQVLEIARKFAGFSYAEADILRKAVGKKIKALLDEQRDKFVSGALKNPAITQKEAEKVWDFIEPFARYGFNRAHAACYALIGYQTAYLKAHFPSEFMAALLTSDQADTDRIAIEVREAKEIGVEVLPPSVNESFADFAVIIGEDGKERIRFGLSAIKNMGSVAAAEIIAERKRGGKFVSLEDFVERVQTKDLNKRSFEALAKVGALEEFGERKQLLESLDVIVAHAKNTKNMASTHAGSLFGDMPLPTMKIRLVSTPPATVKETLLWEKELLGLYVSDHPVKPFGAYLAKTCLPIHSIEKQPDGKRATIGGVVTTVRKALSKGGQTMYFVGLEDLSGRIEILVFGKVAERVGGFLAEDNLLLMDVRVSQRDGAVRLAADDVRKLGEDTLSQFSRVHATHQKYEEKKKIAAPEAPEKKIVIEFGRSADPKLIEELSRVLRSLPPGDTCVSVKILGSTIHTTFRIRDDESTLSRLSELSGVENIRV